jgi:selenium donor protein
MTDLRKDLPPHPRALRWLSRRWVRVTEPRARTAVARPDPRILVGRETFDDAGVFRLSDDLALVQTVDFFAPIVDDPYQFGQVAAANALSDIYAMGGEPLTALSIVGFPVDTLLIEVLTEILRGGQDKVHEAERPLSADTPSLTRS